MGNEALRIADVNFMVTTHIERAPHSTMIRELTMNAIEAAQKASGEKIVHWTSALHNGVRKAVIFNTGPGMSAAELKSATDLACAIDKSLGLDDNFGVGAKVSSLANNRQGMRFRSCKNGRVSQVILGFDEEERSFVRFEMKLATDVSDTVIDVSSAVAREGRSLSCDWTEVMLMGNTEQQDTVSRPIASLPTEKGYIANSLYRRFYRLPASVKLRLDSDYHRFGNVALFKAIGDRYEKFAKTESVRVDELGATIHFLHDPGLQDRSGLRGSSRNALSSTTTTCCLVHKNEMYSVMTGKEWSLAAPRFGIAFGSKELCIHIELDESEARPSQYRERLISRETSEDVVLDHYAFCVIERMPQWVKEVVRNASPRRNEDFSDIQKELQDLLNKYKVKIKSRRIDPTNGTNSSTERGEELRAGAGSSADSAAGSTSGQRAVARRLHEAPEGATTTSLYEVYEKPPQIFMLTDPEEVSEKGLKGRAANFVLETGVLFVNGLYEAVDRAVEDVEPEFANSVDPEVVKKLTVLAARHALAFRVGKAVVFALAKRTSQDWTEIDMKAALAKESLSIAADDYEESLSAIRKYIKQGIKAEKVAA